MAREDRYTLGGVEIKRPSVFRIEKFKITNANRLANGDMVADVLARKRKFYFTYNAITNTELNKILNVIWENDDYFFPFTYVEGGVEKSAIVYPGSLPAELHRPEGNWVWKNVTLNLIEQ